jgi:hypothetical protein
MFNLLSPYLLYLKIAAIVAVLAGTAWVTHQWDVRAYAAAQVVALEKAASEYKASVDMFNKRIAELTGINDDVVAKNQAIKAKLDVSQAQLRKEIANATAKYITPEGKIVDQPDALFTVQFGRVWNSAVERANQGVPAGAADSTGAVEPDLRPADITRQSILDNEADILKQCGKWKADLDSIREWDAKTYAK